MINLEVKLRSRPWNFLPDCHLIVCLCARSADPPPDPDHPAWICSQPDAIPDPYSHPIRRTDCIGGETAAYTAGFSGAVLPAC